MTQNSRINALIGTLMIATFLCGLGFILVGYYLATPDMAVKTKSVSGSVSTLVIIGIMLTVLPIVLAFIGPALAARIARKK